MKRVVTALCLIFAIVGYSAIAAVCLDGWRDDISASLEKIMHSNEIGDTESASRAADELADKWTVLEKKMSIFVRDEKLNIISASVAKIPHFVTEANDELDAEAESVNRQLNLLWRGELPMWYNLL